MADSYVIRIGKKNRKGGFQTVATQYVTSDMGASELNHMYRTRFAGMDVDVELIRLDIIKESIPTMWVSSSGGYGIAVPAVKVRLPGTGNIGKMAAAYSEARSALDRAGDELLTAVKKEYRIEKVELKYEQKNVSIMLPAEDLLRIRDEMNGNNGENNE